MNYVVDFYCPRAKLAVEIDGETHTSASSKKYDSYRTRYLSSLGIKEIRFDNEMIKDDIHAVINRVKLSLPSPEIRRGTRG